MKGRWIARGVKIFGLVVLGALAFGYCTMLLWNALVPELFHGPVVTFWQAVGLLVLSHILFRGMGGHHGHGMNHDRWSRRFDEKLAAMTPEEREKFRNGLHRYCGCGPRDTDSDTK